MELGILDCSDVDPNHKLGLFSQSGESSSVVSMEPIAVFLALLEASGCSAAIQD